MDLEEDMFSLSEQHRITMNKYFVSQATNHLNSDGLETTKKD